MVQRLDHALGSGTGDASLFLPGEQTMNTKRIVFLLAAALLFLSPISQQFLSAQAQGQGRNRGNATAPKPAPHFPDGSPNLGITPEQKGLWLPQDRTELGRRSTLAPVDTIPFQPWAKALYDDRQIRELEPHTRC